MLYFQLFWYCCHNLVTLHMFMSALLSVSPFPFSSISPFPFLYFFSSTPFPFFFSSTPLPFPPLRYFLSEKTICCDCPASPGTHCVSKQRWTKTYFVFRGLVFSLTHWQLSKQWWCNARLEEGETGEEKGGSSIREPFTLPSTLQCWLYTAQNNLPLPSLATLLYNDWLRPFCFRGISPETALSVRPSINQWSLRKSCFLFLAFF